jgi:hypothetical protein
VAISSSSSSSSSGPSSRYVRLRERRNRVYVEGRTQGYRLLLEVEDANGVDPGIFVYERSANPVVGQPPIDDFSNIATPFDIATYPLDAPVPGGTFFRKTSVELLFRNLDLLDQAISDIELDVQSLCRTYNQLEELAEEATTQEITAEAPCDCNVPPEVECPD